MIDSEEGKGICITIQGVFLWVNVLKYMQTINVYKDACVGGEVHIINQMYKENSQGS